MAIIVFVSISNTLSVGDVVQALERSKNSTPCPDRVQYDKIKALHGKDIQTAIREFNEGIQNRMVPEDYL